MKSKALEPQATPAAFKSPVKPSTPDSKPRSIGTMKKSSSLKNEVFVDRTERGRSPTVRGLVWSSSMTTIKPVPPKMPAG